MSKFLLLIMLIMGISIAKAQEKVTFTFSFQDIEEKYMGKEILIGIWSENSEKFLEDNTAEIYKKVTISSTSQSFEMMLPKGVNFAFSCFIDDDGNGDLNTNFIGIPKEPYCFSNNYKPTFSAPDFEDCSFKLSGDQTMKLAFL